MSIAQGVTTLLEVSMKVRVLAKKVYINCVTYSQGAIIVLPERNADGSDVPRWEADVIGNSDRTKGPIVKPILGVKGKPKLFHPDIFEEVKDAKAEVTPAGPGRNGRPPVGGASSEIAEAS